MAKIDKLSGLFKLDPEEEKEIDDRLEMGKNLLAGMEQLEKAGIDFKELKTQLKGTIKLGQTMKDFNKSVKP